MNESRHLDAGTTVMKHIKNESCHTLWMSHVTHYEWVMSHVINQSRDIYRENESCHTLWMSHVTHYKWVMSHLTDEPRHLHGGTESCHTCGWVTSHMWMSHVTHWDESCHACGWVTSHIGMSRVQYKSHVTHYGWITLHIMDESSSFTMCDMARDSFTMCDMVRDSFAICDMCCTSWKNHVTHCGWVCHRVWKSHVMCTNAASYVTSYERVTSHIMNESCHTFWMSQVTCTNETRVLEGHPNLLVIFHCVCMFECVVVFLCAFEGGGGGGGWG